MPCKSFSETCRRSVPSVKPCCEIQVATWIGSVERLQVVRAWAFNKGEMKELFNSAQSPSTSRQFMGALIKYKVMRITSHKSGLQEARINGDAEQGTQDLGFLAAIDRLLEVSGS